MTASTEQAAGGRGSTGRWLTLVLFTLLAGPISTTLVWVSYSSGGCAPGHPWTIAGWALLLSLFACLVGLLVAPLTLFWGCSVVAGLLVGDVQQQILFGTCCTWRGYETLLELVALLALPVASLTSYLLVAGLALRRPTSPGRAALFVVPCTFAACGLIWRLSYLEDAARCASFVCDR